MKLAPQEKGVENFSGWYPSYVLVFHRLLQVFIWVTFVRKQQDKALDLTHNEILMWNINKVHVLDSTVVHNVSVFNLYFTTFLTIFLLFRVSIKFSYYESKYYDVLDNLLYINSLRVNNRKYIVIDRGKVMINMWREVRTKTVRSFKIPMYKKKTKIDTDFPKRIKYYKLHTMTKNNKYTIRQTG